MTTALNKLQEQIVNENKSEKMPGNDSLFFRIKDQWNNIRWDKDKIKKSFILLTIISLSIILVLMFHQNSSVTDITATQNKRSEKMLRELTDISVQLQQIAQNENLSAAHQEAIQTIKKDIFDIQNSVSTTAKSSEIKKISDQISTVKDDVDTQIGDLKKVVTSSLGNKEYLDESALPFRVVSVDVISQEPYVSVDYSHHVSPLAIGDLLAGWRVVSADYDSGIAEFANDKNQFVKVSMQG